MRMRHSGGYTLFEVSIVLLIIGLLVGGIYTGSTLVRSAQLEKAYSQQAGYVAAVNTFMSKYDCLPGDCKNATSFFPADGSCPADNGDAPEPAVCNGNGDSVLATGYEPFETWRHLAAAQLIPGVFSGAPGSDTTTTADVSCPQIWNKSYCWMWIDTTSDTGTYTLQGNKYYSNTLIAMFWATTPIISEMSWVDWLISSSYAMNILYPNAALGALSPADAFSYDAKYDDGHPAQGNIQAFREEVTPNCTTTQDVNAQYKITEKRRSCLMIHKTNF